jgi:isoamylase
MRTEEWDEGAACFGMLIDGHSQSTGVRQRGTEATMLLLLNNHHEPVQFTLPSHPGGRSWQLLVDSDVPDLDSGAQLTSGAVHAVSARSLLLLLQAESDGDH